MRLLLACVATALLCLASGCAAPGGPAAASPSSGKVEVFGDIDAGVSVRR